MKRTEILFTLFAFIVISGCVAKPNKTVDAKYADYGFVCPLTFIFTNNFPTMKDFVNEEFLNEDFSIKEVKKEGKSYLVSYNNVSDDGKISATYTVGFELSDSDKTVSCSSLLCVMSGQELFNMKRPELDMSSQSGMRKIGQFYGAMDESFQLIFDINKINAAIN